jgi:hypothetical protein
MDGGSHPLPGGGAPPSGSTVDLLWIPLGSGGRVVRRCGRAFEALSALVQRRTPCDLYHSALAVHCPDGDFVIEMTPIPGPQGHGRGVVVEGPVGSTWAGRFRLFRYEVRRWQGGVIPDAGAAVSTVSLALDATAVRRLLERVPSVPTPVWGRDELRAGEMWNSNSVTSWLLAQAGVDVAQIALPPGGRAPGWHAGLIVAGRDPASQLFDATG